MESKLVHQAIKYLSSKGYFVIPEPVSDYQAVKPKCYIRIIRPNENKFKQKRYLTKVVDNAKKIPVVFSQNTHKDVCLLHEKLKKVAVELHQILTKDQPLVKQ